MITPEDRAAIDKAFPADIESVYVIHTGTFNNKQNPNDQGLAGAVTTRLTEADAKGVAECLNNSQEGVLYLKWAASACFPTATGGRAELMEAVGTPEVRALWEELASKHRKEIYRVTHVKIANERDVKILARELKDK